MCIALVGRDVGLVEVVGPDGVEGGHVARHAGHEGGQQPGQRQAQQARADNTFDQRKNHAVVIVLTDASCSRVFSLRLLASGLALLVLDKRFHLVGLVEVDGVVRAAW